MTQLHPLPIRRVLLLGGGGFIGVNLATRLRRAGHDVIVAGRTAHGDAQALPLSAVDAIDALVAERRVDTVVHLASTLLPGSSEGDFLAEREHIAGPTAQLAGRLADRGVVLMFLSSGGTVYGVHASAAVAEDDPCHPISFYGQSKLEMELYLRFLERTRGLRCLIMRPSNPYGPGQALGGTQGLVSVLLDRIRRDCPLQVWGDGSTVRDYIHIDDLVEPMARLIEQGSWGMTLNIGSGTGHSLLDVVRAVEGATGHTVRLEFQPPRAADVPRFVLDVSRLQAMGLYQTRPLEAGIAAYLATLKDWP
jgi:UDP-glucose 4-epimerase